ncbi:IS3 family transposase [Amycolatopsis mediterranei S699]|uniref:IS3 family transposase n=2 Tax=Amycolatopsis mediterranei TaxID=33910 RepID=A0A0H3DK62_AMYMU|nr:IS3 family transposase [Amycolatopsis mediterranei]ADJ49443.1 IS3 family transposase [Amycolatopsis mediterranei U32]ADJ50607.1 IS3 family transposase [Amycolatopsis mediterranei U32]AEK46415.1 IS3 family transposase [Amycolatopsis mediterranei S699]AEK47613.1 IS3 family transposase [Amycolatopsis mediterranei S699]AFO81151.1 IS3 family transposase [Amycolatopsis mediterranei S699]
MSYRYRFISEHRPAFGVKRLCQVLGLRRQGFHEWVAAETARAARAEAEQELLTLITSIHAEHRGAYGVPRVTAELHRRGHLVNHKRVERLMREHGLAGITRRKRRTLTRPAAGPVTPVGDLIRRNFTAEKPGQRFVGDITCLPTFEGWLYLATVIDLHTREVVGHAMAEHMRTDLVCDAVDLATARGLIKPDAVFHSDRGVQYTSGQFRAALAEKNIRPSIGRVGSCYDNAVAEAFFATLKTEIGATIWRTRAQARQDVFRYLRYYNHKRLHSTVGQNTPAEARNSYVQAPAA